MIGERIPRLEDARFVVGQGRYTDDIQVEGQTYAAFLRSPHAHARIVSIDTSDAASAPGVLAVFTGQDYVQSGCKGISHLANPIGPVRYKEPTFANSLTGRIVDKLHMPLAIDKVRHVGEPVVMVVAQSPHAAREAVERVRIDFETLDAVVRADDAMADSAPQVWDDVPGNLYFRVQEGDRETARKVFADAHHVVRREFRHSRVVNCQMEPRSVIGDFDAATGRYTVISGSQGVMRQKAALVAALGVTPDQIRVVCPDVGGGFGPRSMVYPEQTAVAWASRMVGRPVKWTCDRSEAFVSDYQGRDTLMRGAMAFDREGRILAIDHEWIGNVGAHPVSYVPMANGTRIINTVYHIPVTAVQITAVASNTVPTVPYRGAGRPEAVHLMERLLDLAARDLGIDRIEIRRRNIITRDKLPYVNPMGLTYDSGDFLGNMEMALKLSQWDGFEQRRQVSEAAGRLRGIGLANYLEAPVGTPRERVEVTIMEDGTVDVVAGTQSTGQGHETSFAQVIASLLGVPMKHVRLRTGDTAFVKEGGGTHSDRSMRLVGTLLVQACEKLLAIGRQAVSEMRQISVEHIRFHEGRFVIEAEQGGSEIALQDVAKHVAIQGTAGDATLKAMRVDVDFEGRLPAHPTGVAVCELEVDPDTGTVVLCDYTSVDDSGRLINPLIVEGQVHGGLAQGLGQALSEGYYMDRETGQVLSGSYMDYGVPRAGCIPTLNVAVVNDPTAGNPLGVKGGGEGGTMPATACVFNALADALSAVRTDELPMPATPGAIWDFIHRTATVAAMHSHH
jgi:carbon-monoxide dehydrogenase large subunit